MYLLYLDEAGVSDGWDEQNNFVIAGIAVHEGKIYEISKKVDKLQETYFPKIKIPIPFHAHDIRHAKNHFREIKQEKRNEIFHNIYSLIGNCKFPDLIIFATIIDISAVDNKTKVLERVFGDVCEKFNSFLMHQKKYLNKPTKGLLIIDKNREEYYRDLVNEFKKQTMHGYLGNVVDIPYFARCNQTRMLQLADFVASAVYQYYEHFDDSCLKIILPRIYQGLADWGEKYNLGSAHMIDDFERCNCFLCSERKKKKIIQKKQKRYTTYTKPQKQHYR